MTEQSQAERRPDPAARGHRAGPHRVRRSSARPRRSTPPSTGSGTRVGLATVYRNLQAMALDGEVDVIRTPEGEAVYRSCSTDHHHHVVCRSCGLAVEVDRRCRGAVGRVGRGRARLHRRCATPSRWTACAPPARPPAADPATRAGSGAGRRPALPRDEHRVGVARAVEHRRERRREGVEVARAGRPPVGLRGEDRLRVAPTPGNRGRGETNLLRCTYTCAYQLQTWLCWPRAEQDDLRRRVRPGALPAGPGARGRQPLAGHHAGGCSGSSSSRRAGSRDSTRSPSASAPVSASASGSSGVLLVEWERSTKGRHGAVQRLPQPHRQVRAVHSSDPRSTCTRAAPTARPPAGASTSRATRPGAPPRPAPPSRSSTPWTSCAERVPPSWPPSSPRPATCPTSRTSTSDGAPRHRLTPPTRRLARDPPVPERTCSQ